MAAWASWRLEPSPWCRPRPRDVTPPRSDPNSACFGRSADTNAHPLLFSAVDVKAPYGTEQSAEEEEKVSPCIVSFSINGSVAMVVDVTVAMSLVTSRRPCCLWRHNGHVCTSHRPCWIPQRYYKTVRSYFEWLEWKVCFPCPQFRLWLL